MAGIASALSGLGDYTSAVRLWACVEHEERAIGVRISELHRPRYEQWIKRGTTALGPNEAGRIRHDAEDTDWDDALAEAKALVQQHAP